MKYICSLIIISFVRDIISKMSSHRDCPARTKYNDKTAKALKPPSTNDVLTLV